MTFAPDLHPSDRRGEDADLLAGVRRGDEDALERLLMRAQEVAYRFSVLICGAAASDAEDAMQDALVTVYRRIGQLRDPGAFRAWLYRTVKNACLIGRRKRVHEPNRLLSLEEVMPADDLPVAAGERSPEQLVIDGRLRSRLRGALASLPPPFRVVVFLRDVEGLSTREVAQVLGISEDNVKTRLHRARLQLRKALERDMKAGARR